MLNSEHSEDEQLKSSKSLEATEDNAQFERVIYEKKKNNF